MVTSARIAGTVAFALYGHDEHARAGLGPRRADAVVRAALRGDRRDAEVGSALVVGTPVTHGERVIGALRAAVPQSVVSDRTHDAILLMIGIGVLAVGVGSTLIAMYQSRRLARPSSPFAEAAARLGEGDFSARAEPSGIAEVDAVSETLGSTAARLDRMLQRERAWRKTRPSAQQHPAHRPAHSTSKPHASRRPSRDDLLDAALSEVDRLERTIDDLLTLAREPPVTAGHPPISRRCSRRSRTTGTDGSRPRVVRFVSTSIPASRQSPSRSARSAK